MSEWYAERVLARRRARRIKDAVIRPRQKAPFKSKVALGERTIECTSSFIKLAGAPFESLRPVIIPRVRPEVKTSVLRLSHY